MKRKYENGFEVICTKPSAYNFTKIKIRRKEKANKSDTCVKYVCDTWIKGYDYPMTFVIKETNIDEFVDYLED